MDVKTIREALRRQPFEPFIMRLADGREFAVPHPEFAALTGRTVIVAHEALDGTYSTIEPLLIVSLEHSGGQQTSPPDATNGDS